MKLYTTKYEELLITLSNYNGQLVSDLFQTPLTINFSSSPEFCDVCDESHEVFPFLANGGWIPEEELAIYETRYRPIAIEDWIDDWNAPFNAVVVDLSEEQLPVFMIGYQTGCKLEKINVSAEEFISEFLKIPSVSDIEPEIHRVMVRLEHLLMEQNTHELYMYTNKYVDKWKLLELITQKDISEEILEMMCRILYSNAVALMDKGDDDSARTIFESIIGTHKGNTIPIQEEAPY